MTQSNTQSGPIPLTASEALAANLLVCIVNASGIARRRPAQHQDR
jgi:hypothetical protein